MRAPRLSLLLVLLSTALLALAMGAVALSATRVLGRVAEEQALDAARVEAARVVERLRAAQEELATTARLLAERPTLRRIVAAGDTARAAEFLERFRAAGGLDVCAVFVAGAPFAASGEPPGPELTDSIASRVRSRLTLSDDGRRARLAAFEVAEGTPAAVVAVARSVDAVSARDTAARAGLSARVHGRVAIEAAGFGPRSRLRDAALAAGRAGAAPVPEEGVYLATAPIRSAGEIVGIVEAEIAGSEVAAVRSRWVGALRRIVLPVLALAVLGSFVLGWLLTRPVEALARSARRIGLGDLETPVAARGGGVTDVLAHTMEDMRLRLLETTRELRLRQAGTEAVLAGITEGVFTVDPARRIRYMNPQAARMLGIEAGAAVGRFCGEVLRPVGPDGVRPCEEACPIVHARAGTTARAVEQLAVGAGRRTAVVTSSAPAEGQQVQLLRDETDVEVTRRLRDTVVANISHEFKTPLAAQLASIEMLRDRLGELPPAETERLVFALERGALRLTRLVDNLLESVRLEAGQDAIRRRALALDEVVEEAVESTRPLIEQREQRLAVDLPHPLPAVVGDGPRLVQVLVNLLANANKFAPAGTTIRVGGAVASGGVTLWVADEGPGLPEGEDESIFRRFVRTPGEEPEQGGMGLGLWIARSIVARHGGRLYSAAAERGAKLCVWLPEATGEDPRR